MAGEPLHIIIVEACGSANRAIAKEHNLSKFIGFPFLVLVNIKGLSRAVQVHWVTKRIVSIYVAKEVPYLVQD